MNASQKPLFLVEKKTDVKKYILYDSIYIKF